MRKIVLTVFGALVFGSILTYSEDSKAWCDYGNTTEQYGNCVYLLSPLWYNCTPDGGTLVTLLYCVEADSGNQGNQQD